jgi:hypothetical protein
MSTEWDKKASIPTIPVNDQKANLLKLVAEAAAAGLWDKVEALSKEISTVGKNVKAEADKATEGDRKTAKEALTVALTTEDMGKAIMAALRASTIKITAKRSAPSPEHPLGLLDDTKAIITTGKAYDAVIDAVRAIVEPIASVKGVEVVISNGKVEVDLSTVARQSSGGGGNGGGARGWSKDGAQFKLSDVFATVATDQELADEAAFTDKGDGNRSFQLKKKVAVAAGYSQN